MAPGSRFGRPLAVLKTHPKAFCEGKQGRAGSAGATKCVPGAGKVFTKHNREYLGSVGPLWRHMVKVKISNCEVFTPLACAWGPSGGVPNLLSNHDQVVVANVKQIKKKPTFLRNSKHLPKKRRRCLEPLHASQVVFEGSLEISELNIFTTSSVVRCGHESGSEQPRRGVKSAKRADFLVKTGCL